MQAQRKQYGAMVYFYRCQLIEGGINLETKLYKDYAWIHRYVRGLALAILIIQIYQFLCRFMCGPPDRKI